MEKKKIKHCTLRHFYKLGGTKDTDILYKIISLQCSCVRRLFDKNLHVWKIISLYLIEKVFRANSEFHSNLDIAKCPLKMIPLFYQEILMGWIFLLQSIFHQKLHLTFMV